MKKLIPVIIAMFLFASGYAQVPMLTLGPKIGFNTNKIKTDLSDVKEDLKAGFEIGAFVRIGKKIYVQPEVMFKTQNSKFNVDTKDAQGNVIDVDYKVKMKTIDIPVMIGAKLIDAKVFNIRIMTGPVISMLANKEIDTDEKYKDTFLNEDDFKNANWYWGFGAGVDVLMFTLDVRYNLGLNDIYDGKINNTDINPELKANLFNVTLGWKIL
ncbi:MAG: PorT family protein [Bacteroidetes bacterium]|nr:PorT family protein [Bacteroidota bacterium]